MTEDRKHATDVFYEVSMKRLDEQWERIDTLNTRAQSVLTFASAVLPIVSAAIIVSRSNLNTTVIGLLAFSVIIYLIVAGLTFGSMWPRNWSLRPDIPSLQAAAANQDEITIKWKVAEECAKSIEENDKNLQAKANLLEYALMIVPVQILLLTLAILAVASS